MSKDDTQHALVPRLRFPEFRDAPEWDRSRLAETIGTVSPPKKLQTSLYLTDGRFPVIDQSPDDTCGWTNDEGAVITKPLPAIVFGDHTCTLKLVRRPFAQGADGIKIFVAKGNVETEYLYHFLSSRPVKMESYKRHFAALKTVEVFHSGDRLAEQRKIAACLGSLDDLIAAEGRKLAALREHKKGLMQQLFPREGETRPRLRFPEFQDAPEWDPTTIGEHVYLLSGFPFDGKDIVEDSAGVPLMRGINITEGRVRHDPDYDRFYLGPTEDLAKYHLQQGDLVIGMDGSKVGKNSAMISSADAGALLVQRVARLRSDRQVTMRFIFQLVNSPKFHSYVDRINTSSGIPHISAKQIRDFSLALPCDTEQQHIADCLSALDTLIAAQAEKLDALRTHKRGLMQQLFPPPEDAEL